MTDSNKTCKVTKLFDEAGAAEDKVVAVLKDVGEKIYSDAKFQEDVETAAQEISGCMKVTRGKHGGLSIELDQEAFVSKMEQALQARGFNFNSSKVVVATRGEAEKLHDPALCNPAEPVPAAS